MILCDDIEYETEEWSKEEAMPLLEDASVVEEAEMGRLLAVVK